jgi:hypothetical protein
VVGGAEGAEVEARPRKPRCRGRGGKENFASGRCSSPGSNNLARVDDPAGLQFIRWALSFSAFNITDIQLTLDELFYNRWLQFHCAALYPYISCSDAFENIK